MRRTKIVCTIGPKTCDYQQLEKLAEGGMNVARLNMSHGTHEWHRKVIKGIHTLNEKGQYSIAVMMDTKGPEIRSGDLKVELDLKKGDTFTFTTKRQAEYAPFTTEVNYDDFIKDVKVGDIILVDGGMLSMKVNKKTKTDAICECMDTGKMGSRRHLNIRGKSAKLPSITKKDWDDIKFGIEEGVDFLALSFVKNPQAIMELKKYLADQKIVIDVIAKIESAAAIPHLEEIIEAADGVMVARGDLGAEIPLEEVPLVQEEIVKIARELGKPVVVATHLLESMIVHPTPTRAEVTDITHAILQRADSIMLSGETAAGNHPMKSLEVMDTVAKRIEKKLRESKKIMVEASNVKESMVMSASIMANNLEGSAIIVITRRGHMAGLLSRCRPNPPIYAFTNTTNVRRRLNIYWGVTSFRIDFSKDPEKTIQRAIALLKNRKLAKTMNRVIVVSDILASDEFVETVQIRTIK